jgi:hypothetical protein
MKTWNIGDQVTATDLNANFDITQNIHFGDGSDGSYTLDGTQAAVAGLFSKSGSTYTMLRDGYFDTLIINSGVILKSQNFRLFGKTEIKNNGTIQCNGGDASNDIGGTAVPTGTYAQVGNGPNGGYAGTNGAGAYAAGTPAASNPSAVGSNGVNSGDGNVGATRTPTTVNPISDYNNLRTLLQIAVGAYPVRMTTSAGSAAASGPGSSSGPFTCSKGGGAGAVGGTIGIFAKLWSGNGVVEAKGGAGGQGGSGGTYACTGGSGGGGGNGGFIFIFFATKTYTGTLVVTGGTGGPFGTKAATGGGGGWVDGTVGQNGATGNTLEINV